MTDNSTPPPPPPPPPEQPPGGQPAGGPPSGGQPMSEQDEKTYLLISHIGMIITGFLAPLIIWLIAKDRSARIDTEGKDILNFGIMISIAYIVGAILWIILIGGLVQLAAFVVAVIFGIQGAMAVNRGETYKYPFNLSLVK